MQNTPIWKSRLISFSLIAVLILSRSVSAQSTSNCVPLLDGSFACIDTLTPISASVGAGTLETHADFKARLGRDFQFLDGQCFESGIFAHASSSVIYSIPPGANFFNFYYGYEDHSYILGLDHDLLHAFFRVKIDGVTVWASPETQYRDGARFQSVNVSGGQTLTLETSPIGPRGIDNRHTAWVNACFSGTEEEPEDPQIPELKERIEVLEAEVEALNDVTDAIVEAIDDTNSALAELEEWHDMLTQEFDDFVEITNARINALEDDDEDNDNHDDDDDDNDDDDDD